MAYFQKRDKHIERVEKYPDMGRSGVLQSDGQFFDRVAEFFGDEDDFRVESEAVDGGPGEYFLRDVPAENFESALCVLDFPTVMDDFAEHPESPFHYFPVPQDRSKDFEAWNETRGDRDVASLGYGHREFLQFLDRNRQIGVQEHHQSVTAAHNPVAHRFAFAGIGRIVDYFYGEIPSRPFEFVQSVVRTAVIDSDYFKNPERVFQVGVYFFYVPMDGFTLVETGDDYRYLIIHTCLFR